ncbi:dihydrosphingosine 1-phosphate phosphatase Lcb3p [[Candida] railenensis]|uniref:Dihydrosphingosine 1-phosphate phosphatase Lcb3p n=1 Tax=[Candida] railenensis TaxID=45579 RepID=A0A9P0VZK5_9ASCO|nr:dihydrosphingosine 1-phosphate phosphatase Lcb3p [[Candida] railenensis]
MQSSSGSRMHEGSETISKRATKIPPPTPTHTDSYVKDSTPEAGTGSNNHYKSKLSPFRYTLRSKCLPLIRAENDILLSVQTNLRNPWLDLYFAWTANLASHTFYVLMLPIPLWFGGGKLARDLVHVLGLGIFFTGNLKDYLCLPRPRSPPLHRITMSTYTAQEYGFPSSHSANATAVTLVFFHHIMNTEQISGLGKIILYVILAIYYVSLIFGRIYCGMHGFFDVITGAVLGIVLFLFRTYFGTTFDNLQLSTLGWFSPILIIVGYVSLIHFHSEPVDDCPCFDDSVAFIGVLIGLDTSHWWFVRSGYLGGEIYAIPFNFAELGILKTCLRVILGIVLVATWKAISKPIIFTILPPVYKTVGVYLPRRNFEATAFSTKTTRQIRSQSLSNMNRQEKNGDFIHTHGKRDDIGPENDIDVYEMLDYEKERRKSMDFDEPDIVPNSPSPVLSGVFRPRYDVEIVGRLIVYAGVATFATWGFTVATEFTNLS